MEKQQLSQGFAVGSTTKFQRAISIWGAFAALLLRIAARITEIWNTTMLMHSRPVWRGERTALKQSSRWRVEVPSFCSD